VAQATFFVLRRGIDLRFYTVSDAYISFLQQFDPKVPNNGGAAYKGRKLYIGVVLEIGGHKYFAPLSSYKAKQDKISSSSCSLFKLHERGNENNKLGIISLNNMVPVPDSELVLLDLDGQDEQYKRMLLKQYEFIKESRDEIARRAAKLHNHVVVKRTPHFVLISCDIPTLVDQAIKYLPAT
jgi:protein AbiQ